MFSALTNKFSTWFIFCIKHMLNNHKIPFIRSFLPSGDQIEVRHFTGLRSTCCIRGSKTTCCIPMWGWQESKANNNYIKASMAPKRRDAHGSIVANQISCAKKFSALYFFFFSFLQKKIGERKIEMKYFDLFQLQISFYAS